MVDALLNSSRVRKRNSEGSRTPLTVANTCLLIEYKHLSATSLVISISARQSDLFLKFADKFVMCGTSHLNQESQHKDQECCTECTNFVIGRILLRDSSFSDSAGNLSHSTGRNLPRYRRSDTTDWLLI